MARKSGKSITDLFQEGKKETAYTIYKNMCRLVYYSRWSSATNVNDEVEDKM